MSAAFALSERPTAYSRIALLDALHAVENPRDTHKPGAHGELGRLQITRDTWREYTTLPYDDEHVWAEEYGVALRHIAWMEGALKANGLEVTVFNVALMWNAGHGLVIRRVLPPSSLDFAKRVDNLVRDSQGLVK